MPDAAPDQIEKAFQNVDAAVRGAGGKGWESVYKVRSYHVGLDEEALNASVATMKRWCPGHEPLWTVLGVKELAGPEYKVEIEVCAKVA